MYLKDALKKRVSNGFKETITELVSITCDNPMLLQLVLCK